MAFMHNGNGPVGCFLMLTSRIAGNIEEHAVHVVS